MTEPVRPEDNEVDEATEKVVRERLKTVDEDAKTASPWADVKKRILSQPVPR